MTRREEKQLRQARTPHGRRKNSLTLCEGLRCCQEALNRRPDWLEFGLAANTFADSPEAAWFRQRCRQLGKEFHVIADPDFARMAVTENPQGLLLLLRSPIHEEQHETGMNTALVLPVLDRIGDPGNLGTILRTVWAVGLTRVWLVQGTTDPFGPKAIRAGMGAQFALRLQWFPDLAEVRKALDVAQFATLWCAVPEGGISCYDEAFDLRRSALVIGNEAHGVADMDIGRKVSIPMPGTAESLNAAQAATLLLFEAVRRGLLQQESGSTL